MECIENRRFGEERALYGLSGAMVKNCRFEGEEDGESALKECKNIVVDGCRMDLRYPFWHAEGLTFANGEMTENCRAAMWYDRDVTIRNSRMNGIKALRECRGIVLENSEAHSPEFAWRCADLRVADSTVASEYAFFESRNIAAEKLRFTGKYSFQYVKNVRIAHSQLDTKDAFWHAKNVTVTDSVLNGEYLGWYSEGLTLVRCRISGTQPLCYCRRLRLIDCTTEGCDLSFEYSDVRAAIKGEILSVKNPRRGRVAADAIGEVIRTSDSKYPAKAAVWAGGIRK